MAYISHPKTLAIMVTMTTYGTWLRGDRRGWVEKGQILPANPELESADRARLQHSPHLFNETQLHNVGQMIGDSLVSRKAITILALSVASWHIHFVFGATKHDIGEIVKCAKDSTRYGLNLNRPIWTKGYDKRFCFDESSARNRVRYVELHNTHAGWEARPWPFITDVEQYLQHRI